MQAQVPPAIRYNIKLWKLFGDCFNTLPVMAIIDDKIICMHGGLSPDLNSFQQIDKIKRPAEVPDTGTIKNLRYLVRPAVERPRSRLPGLGRE